MSRPVAVGAGLLALALGWLVAPHAPALYDGLRFPDEPYRYSQVLATDPVKTAPPTTARGVLQVSGGTNTNGQAVASSEMGPQVALVVPATALHAGPATVTAVTLTATPLAPPAQAPADGPIAGDVYRVALDPAATWSSGRAGVISLRSPQGTPYQPLVEHRDPGATAWDALSTTRTGNDIWSAPISAAGDYALVLPIHKRPMSRSHAVVYAVGGAVLAVALLVLAIRLRRTRGRADALPGSDGPDPDPA